MLLFAPAFLFLSLASAAAVSPNKNCVTATHQFCQTTYATTKPRSIKTTTKTYTRTWSGTRTVVITPSTTITPAQQTSTVTNVLTTSITQTAPTMTDTTTVYSTSTETDTETDTTTTTQVSFVTVTTTTTSSGTSTIPTSAGFTPVASESSVVNNGGGVQYGSQKKREIIDERDIDERAIDERAAAVNKTNKFCLQGGKKYPKSVACYKDIDVHTYTTRYVIATQTTTFTAATPAPVVVTSTSTESDTTTITPADFTVTASSALTETTTVTTSVTSTVSTTTTQTSTSTSFLPIQTVYAACAANNIISAVGSSRIDNFQRPSNGAFVSNPSTDPNSCCGACQQSGACVGFAYSGDVGCVLTTRGDGQCDPTQQDWSFFNDGYFPSSFIVGNGNCGQGIWSGTSGASIS